MCEPFTPGQGSQVDNILHYIIRCRRFQVPAVRCRKTVNFFWIGLAVCNLVVIIYQRGVDKALKM